MDSDGDAVGAAPRRRPLDFARINAVALSNLTVILHRWMPSGTVRRGEFTACNPQRVDNHPGSFRINVRTCRWSDFATGDKGGDPISLAAYLSGLSQYEAAAELANMLGIKSGGSD